MPMHLSMWSRLVHMLCLWSLWPSSSENCMHYWPLCLQKVQLAKQIHKTDEWYTNVVVDYVLTLLSHLLCQCPLNVYPVRLHRHKWLNFNRLYRTRCTLIEGNSPYIMIILYVSTSFSRLYASDTQSFSWSLVVISTPCMPALSCSKPPNFCEK